MIKYVVTDERATARFDTQGREEKQYWTHNITTNICHLVKSTIFYSLIYAIAWKYVERRSSFTGVMNNPPNVEVGQKIAKQRLLAKYNELEQKVYKKFLTYIEQLPCVATLQDSHKLAIEALMDIQDSIDSFDICHQIINNDEGGLINEL